jgi:hypothetical protein
MFLKVGSEIGESLGLNALLTDIFLWDWKNITEF